MRKAERERAAAEAKAAEEVNTRREAEARAAEQRKKRKVQLALAVAVLLLACGGVAFAWYSDRQSELAKLKQADELLPGIAGGAGDGHCSTRQQANVVYIQRRGGHARGRSSSGTIRIHDRESRHES